MACVLSITGFLSVVTFIDAHVFWKYEALCKGNPKQGMSKTWVLVNVNPLSGFPDLMDQ
jgi:hypothetical protein